MSLTAMSRLLTANARVCAVPITIGMAYYTTLAVSPIFTNANLKTV
jgi:hypothetical protein